MNNLNSVLLEGEVVNDAIGGKTQNGTFACSFTIQSVRYFRRDGTQIEKELSHFDIEAEGNLGENCLKLAKEGRGIRVVGRLKEFFDGTDKSNPKIIIVAEHAEFRPENNEDIKL